MDLGGTTLISATAIVKEFLGLMVASHVSSGRAFGVADASETARGTTAQPTDPFLELDSGARARRTRLSVLTGNALGHHLRTAFSQQSPLPRLG